jgi:O-methyltransferase
MTLGQAVNRVFGLIGLELHRIAPLSNADPAALRLPPEEQTWYGQYWHWVLLPWARDGIFHETWAASKSATTLTVDRGWALYSLARQCATLGLDAVECGVFRGGSALMLCHVFADLHPSGTIHLVDSFEGLPTANASRDVSWLGPRFDDTSVDAVLNLLGPRHASRISIHKGWIPEAFDGLAVNQVGFIHLDLDLYKPTRDAVSFLWPKLAHGGVLLVDDYGFPSCAGVRDAMDLMLSTEPGMLGIPLATGQFLAIKR